MVFQITRPSMDPSARAQPEPQVSLTTWSVFLEVGPIKPRNWSSETARMKRACSTGSGFLASGSASPDNGEDKIIKNALIQNKNRDISCLIQYSTQLSSTLFYRIYRLRSILCDVTYSETPLYIAHPLLT